MRWALSCLSAALAARPWASASPPVDSPALDAAPDRSRVTPAAPPIISPNFLPVMRSIMALKAFATWMSPPMTALITLSTGRKTAISPLPIDARSAFVCCLRRAVWPAHVPRFCLAYPDTVASCCWA